MRQFLSASEWILVAATDLCRIDAGRRCALEDRRWLVDVQHRLV